MQSLPRRRPTVALLTVLAAAALTAAGCTNNSAAPVETVESTTNADNNAAGSGQATTPNPTPNSTPSPIESDLLFPPSPLSGRAQESPQPVLVVKLDNTRNAQPHAGLKDADLVYLEEVEYGITRIAAVFNSTVPSRIGPVRSARITDLDLLSQYGSPGFAFSGAQQKLWPEIASSSLIDLSANKNPSEYERDRNRRAPYNYFFNGQAALKTQEDIATDRDIGFIFSNDVPPDGTLNESARVEWGYASAGFKYDPSNLKYAVRLNGERATSEEGDGLQWADTVVIQLVKQRPSDYFDRGGGNTPFAETIGQGKAIVLRDGMSYPANWSRSDASSGTVFTNERGEIIPFKPGQTWIVLYDTTRAIKIRPRESVSEPSLLAP